MGPTDRGGTGPNGERALPGWLSGRVALLGALAISLAVLVGFSISLLGGVGSSSNRTAAAIPQQKFFGIAQGIFRFDTEDLRTMAATGIGTDRFLLDWAVVQPTPKGPLAWPDKAIGALASHGIEAIPYLWGSPKWVAASQPDAPVDSPQQEEAWRSFLEATVARYGPRGSYWTNGYVQQYGATAKPVPIRAWQIWNEPNLKKFFTPGADVNESAQKYARLLQISNDAIKGQDPQARIILAGLPGFGDVTASELFDALYGVPGFKGSYDAAALHPYAPNVEDLGRQIAQLRATMGEHGDQDTPLWLTELGWGSGAPDRFRLNKGLAGQAQLLNGAFELILNHRRAWNVQRVFWFDWRDPAPASQLAGTCSFCLSAGLLRYTRQPKPSYLAFKNFAGGD
jgi:hypothetical protein